MNNLNYTQKALVDEFICYYAVDGYQMPTELYAKESIERLIHKVDASELYLQILHLLEDRQSSLNYILQEECNFSWTTYDEDWEFYSLLLTAMRDYLLSIKT